MGQQKVHFGSAGPLRRIILVVATLGLIALVAWVSIVLLWVFTLAGGGF